MAYPTELLSDGEQVEFEMRPHWRALIVPGLVLVAVLIGLSIVVPAWTDLFGSEFVSDAGRWLFIIVGFFLFFAFVLRPIAHWWTTQYVFTNRRIIIRSGIISRTGRDMPLSKVNNVSFSVSVIGRILNYGTLEIDSASDEALRINDVTDVEKIQREVSRLHEDDDAYRRGMTA